LTGPGARGKCFPDASGLFFKSRNLFLYIFFQFLYNTKNQTVSQMEHPYFEELETIEKLKKKKYKKLEKFKKQYDMCRGRLL